ncbi:Protein C06E8.5 [Aphelenchoides avenae]|nr:Protein C06E8.5 [Aphelenchus avenae]
MTNALIAEVVTSRVDLSPQRITAGDGKIEVGDMTLHIHSTSIDIRTKVTAPHNVVIDITNLNVSSNAKITGSLEEGSSFTAAATFGPTSSEIHLAVAVLRNARGAPNIRIESCSVTSAQPIRATVSQLQNADQAQLIQNTLSSNARELLEGLICSRTEAVVEERVNDRFGQLASKISLAHVDDNELVQDLATRMMRRQRRVHSVLMGSGQCYVAEISWCGNLPLAECTRANNLFLDYTIMSDIRASNLGIEVESSGEVSLRGRGGTPFGPVDFALPNTVNQNSMLQMAISDFMPNSLMYHGHTVGLFNTKVDPTTPHFGPLMRTSCSLSMGALFCLGDLFPSLRKLHPDRRLALMFSTAQAPVIRFRPQSAGGIQFSLLGKIAILVVDSATKKETQVAEMSIEVAAQMKLRLSSAIVQPRITLNTIKLKTLTPETLTQDELDDAVVLSREVLQRMVNDVLREGIPIPVHPLFRLNKPKVKILDRAILLQTNFELNSELIRQVTAAELRKRAIA